MRDLSPDFHGALVLTGGGTGGHFFPAVALAEGARKRWPGLSIAFVGARRGIEAKALPGGAWPHLLLDVEGFLGRSPLRAAKSAWKLWLATNELKRQWKAALPKAVVGTGGYGAAPALLAARSLKIPYFIHESNAAPGALVKAVAHKAKRVWCGMEEVRPLLSRADCRVVGTPVREVFLRNFSPAAALQAPFRLLVLGGSGGARVINEAMFGLAGDLLDAHPDWEMLHQTGAGHFDDLQDRQRHPRHGLVPFLSRMDEILESASLVLGRSGASTCAELKAVGRASVLVPLPTSANDHQRQNARAMVAEGRALLVEQGPDLAGRLKAALDPLMDDAVTRSQLSKVAERNRAVDLCLDDLACYLG
jgi:UDP-N-acetylglucosamine--N-acetylmuramyl-(pentapeptide) pyrophosphoryl-undecaprenol N-acetylglucosamine transferase